MPEMAPQRSAGSRELCCILWIAYCTFSALYSPQPLLESMRGTLGVSQTSAGLLMTAAVLPLGIAPLLYGLFLDGVALRRLLTLGMTLTGVALLPGLFTSSYSFMLLARFVQGLAAPAIMLGLMLYISTHYSGVLMQRALALYTAVTMIGSFSGRLIGGYVASLFSWRAAFLLLLLESLSAAAAALLLRGEGAAKGQHIAPSEIWAVLTQPDVRRIILVAPLCIMVHASLLNFIPFYMHSLDSGVSEFGIGVVYIGALISSMLGVFSRHVVAKLGGEMHTVMTGLGLFALFLPLVLLRSPWMLFVALLGTSAGFALVYTTMPGVVNRASTHEKAVTNGVYLSAYYLCSAAGTYFPVLLYASCGLEWYVGLLVGIMLLSLGIAAAGRGVQAHLH